MLNCISTHGAGVKRTVSIGEKPETRAQPGGSEGTRNHHNQPTTTRQNKKEKNNETDTYHDNFKTAKARNNTTHLKVHHCPQNSIRHPTYDFTAFDGQEAFVTWQDGQEVEAFMRSTVEPNRTQ